MNSKKLTHLKTSEQTDLRCEGTVEPLGVSIQNPRLSWVNSIASAFKNNPRYRFQVASSLDRLSKNKPDLWNSEFMPLKNPWVDYRGKKFSSQQRYFWRLRSNTGPWSRSASFVSGILSDEKWKAKWIGYRLTPPELHGTAKEALPLFRKDFFLENSPREGIISICGLGHFDLLINGQAVSNDLLVPGWTQYGKSALYITYDVTRFLKRGPNTIGVMLGNGFFNINGDRYTKIKRSFGWPVMICQLSITSTKMTKSCIVSDLSWKVGKSPITFSCIYGGEDYNARLDQPLWSNHGFADSHWAKPVNEAPPCNTLRAQLHQATRVINRIKPLSIRLNKHSELIADFGLNIAGMPAIEVEGIAGKSIELTPSETLDKSGTPDQTISGGPHLYRYTLGKEKLQKWQPRFSYYGYRYLKIKGIKKQEVTLKKLRSLEISACGAPVGHFKSSDTMLTKIHEIVLRSMRSNLQSVMTDCPHREKLGWISDLYFMGPSFINNYALHEFYKKSLDDISDVQELNGRVYTTAPHYLISPGWSAYEDSPEWGLSLVLCPWLIYQRYGDERILLKHYQSIKLYCEYLQSRSDHGIISYGLSDWYDRGPRPPGHSQLTSDGVTATALYFEALKTVSKIATVLGKKGEAKDFLNRSKTTAAAFCKRFLKPQTGVVDTGSQTAQALTLGLGLAPEHDQKILSRLLDDIEAKGDEFTAGNIGHRFLLLALHEAGRSDLIWKIHRRTDRPSYGYQVAKGATTLSEAWDAHPLSSQNHSMLGHIEEWFYECLAGIKPADDACGYSALSINPEFLPDLKEVESSIQTCRGLISSHWKRNQDKIKWNLTIPHGCEAEVKLRSINPKTVQITSRSNQDQLFPKSKSGTESKFSLKTGKYTLQFDSLNPST